MSIIPPFYHSQISRVLDLLNDRIVQISSLAGLSPLVVLEISGDRIGSLDFSNQFPFLKSPIAVANRSRSINLFEDLPDLLRLDLKGNLLTDLRFCLRLRTSSTSKLAAAACHLVLTSKVFISCGGFRALKILWRSFPSSQIPGSKSGFEMQASCINCSAIVFVIFQGTQFISKPDRQPRPTLAPNDDSEPSYIGERKDMELTRQDMVSISHGDGDPMVIPTVVNHLTRQHILSIVIISLFIEIHSFNHTGGATQALLVPVK
jgi:hypothetical protein